MEIKTTKLIKGQGLANLVAKSNCKDLGINKISKENLNEIFGDQSQDQ
jgi:hypothetical protein